MSDYEESCKRSMLNVEVFCERLVQDGEVEKLKAFRELHDKLAGDWVNRTLFLLNSVSAYFGLPNLKAETEKDKAWFSYLRNPKYNGSFTAKVNYE